MPQQVGLSAVDAVAAMSNVRGIRDVSPVPSQRDAAVDVSASMGNGRIAEVRRINALRQQGEDVQELLNLENRYTARAWSSLFRRRAGERGRFAVPDEEPQRAGSAELSHPPEQQARRPRRRGRQLGSAAHRPDDHGVQGSLGAARRPAFADEACDGGTLPKINAILTAAGQPGWRRRWKPTPARRRSRRTRRTSEARREKKQERGTTTGEKAESAGSLIFEVRVLPFHFVSALLVSAFTFTFPSALRFTSVHASRLTVHGSRLPPPSPSCGIPCPRIPWCR